MCHKLFEDLKLFKMSKVRWKVSERERKFNGTIDINNRKLITFSRAAVIFQVFGIKRQVIGFVFQ